MPNKEPEHKHSIPADETKAFHDSGKRYVPWKEARQATLHCLTGCAIGEILGMIIGTAFHLSNLSTIILSILLAFMFGYTLTMKSVLKTGVAFITAITVAFAADTVSITVMEIVDNTVVASIPNALNANLDNPLFWISLAISLAIAFFAAWPVNRYLISRGLGHAKMHQFHTHQ